MSPAVPHPALQTLASAMRGQPLHSMLYTTVDGHPVIARVEPDGVRLYSLGTMGAASGPAPSPSTQHAIIQLTSFAILAFASAFGVGWAFFHDGLHRDDR